MEPITEINNTINYLPIIFRIFKNILVLYLVYISIKAINIYIKNNS